MKKNEYNYLIIFKLQHPILRLNELLCTTPSLYPKHQPQSIKVLTQLVIKIHAVWSRTPSLSLLGCT